MDMESIEIGRVSAQPFVVQLEGSTMLDLVVRKGTVQQAEVRILLFVLDARPADYVKTALRGHCSLEVSDSDSGIARIVEQDAAPKRCRPMFREHLDRRAQMVRLRITIIICKGENLSSRMRDRGILGAGERGCCRAEMPYPHPLTQGAS